MSDFTVTVEKLLYGGDALARRGDGKAVFIPFAVPGDRLRVRPAVEKKNYIHAEILEIITPGEGRVTPVCQHFGKCGGCDWQQLEYFRQVEAKRRILEELFHHRFPETRRLTITMQPCPQPFGYRSRARVRRGADRAAGRKTEGLASPLVGFFRGGSHIIEDMESCPLFRPSLNEALLSLRRVPPDEYSGNVLEIDIASSEEEGKWATSNDDGKETLLQRKVGEFIYNVAAGTFFQANDFIIDALLEYVMGCTSQNCGQNFGAALDLFSGVGLFSLPLAQRYSAVTSVEYSREARELCVMNAAEAGIENLENVCADTAEWLSSQTGRFDCVVLDPPRAGVGFGVMERIERLVDGSLVYVSCDPQTLVRDMERLNMDRLRIVSIAGFDMFPQTHHFETVIHLETASS